MKILLVSANTLKAPYPVYPLGLDHVAGSIDGRHRVRIADLNSLDHDRALPDAIREFAPHLIGISLRNIDNTDTTDPRGFIGGYRSLMKTVRQTSPAPVVLGGSGFTLFPRRVLTELGADFGIVGEGERLNLLIDALEAGRNPAAVPGVILPQGPETDFPPPWSGNRRPRPRQHSEHLPWYLEHGAMLNLQTQRGCPFRCIYCTYPLIEGRKLRRVPPADAARTAVELEAAGARYLYITDSSFNADVEHSLAVARAFRKEGLTIPWGAFFTPLALPEGYFDTLAAAGLKHLEFGTDTLCSEVMRSYGKPFTVAQVMDAHQAGLNAGCHVAHYFLLGGPGETRQTLGITLGNIERLDKTVLFFFCGMRVYPHTRLYRQCVEDGQVGDGKDLLEPVFYRNPSVDEETIERRVVEKAGGRVNWVVGAGGDATADIVRRMYARGFSGPLWEYLIR
jgi:radical SAM superfamily enzyme YgiQ (UPF0313 family)